MTEREEPLEYFRKFVPFTGKARPHFSENQFEEGAISKISR